MFEPGYYKINNRALRLRDAINWFGALLGVPIWFVTRFIPALSISGRWMPVLWTDSECKPADLSDDFWQATKTYRDDFERLGFTRCRLEKLPKSLHPAVRNGGVIFYLDPTRSHLGRLAYVRFYNVILRKEVNKIRFSFIAVFENDTLSCASHGSTFDPAESGTVIRLNLTDVPGVYSRFREELGRRPETPRSFPDLESLRQWFNSRHVKGLEDRVQRRLFIRMTEPEVAAARARTDPSGQIRFLRHVRLAWLVLISSLILLAVLTVYRHRQMPKSIGGNNISVNTVDYQGQHFRMRSHADFEDYKNNPNNLDTNEFPRIERTMESVKIPATFKNFNDFVYFTTKLDFPGYYRDGGGGGQTDDGLTFQWVSIEIPQADKERVVVGQSESAENWKLGSWKVVDDFIYAGSDTNDISRVQLQHRQLEYFDQKGQLIRKKSL